MKWPVSDKLVETIIGDFHSRLQMMEDMVKASQARYDDLLTKYHALKVSGAGEPPKPAVPAEREMDVVTQAIIAKSRGNPVLFRHYQTFVAERRALGTMEDAIAREIVQGQDDDGLSV